VRDPHRPARELLRSPRSVWFGVGRAGATTTPRSWLALVAFASARMGLAMASTLSAVEAKEGLCETNRKLGCDFNSGRGGGGSECQDLAFHCCRCAPVRLEPW
jgi:hypothetical protein